MLTLKNLQKLIYQICIQSFDMKGSPYHDFEESDRYPKKQEKKIAYLWGGQLAQLAAVAGQKQWFDTVVFTAEGENCPAAQVSPFVEIVYKDTQDAVQAIMDSWVDAVTAEWENVPASLAKAISEAGIDMFPNWRVYNLVQHRATEKEAIINCFNGDKDSVVNFTRVNRQNADHDIYRAFEDIWPGILKTARDGYDGKGQQKINTKDDLDTYIANVREEQSQLESLTSTWATTQDIMKFKKGREYVDFDEVECIYEEQQKDFYEISVMVARSSNGDIVSFDPAYNKHEKGILTESIMPAWESGDERITPEVIEKAKAMAEQLTEKYAWDEGIIWLVGVEMFVLKDGSIKINEIAPRPHNSGHPTEYSHDYSQYELLNLAITWQKLPTPKLIKKVHLDNMLSDEVLSIPGINEKTWEEERIHDKWFGVYEYTDGNWNFIVTKDYGKWKPGFLKWDSDEQEVKWQRKRWHMNTISNLNPDLLEKFYKKTT